MNLHRKTATRSESKVRAPIADPAALSGASEWPVGKN